jgi:alpha/beta superfamily hydrolase
MIRTDAAGHQLLRKLFPRILPMPREQPLFFELGNDRLFGILHVPDKANPGHGLVICHALAEEKLWSHRVFVELARELAKRGIAALRFDFRGEGESDLEFEQTGIETRIQDAVRAAELLLEKEPSLRAVTLLGHRLGGAIALAAARRLGPKARGVVVWDPLQSGREYLMQWLRSNLAKQIAVEGKAPRTRQALIQALDGGETVIVDGYGIGAPLYQELVALELPALLDAIECPALVLAAEEAPGRSCANAQWVSAREPAFWRESKELYRSAPNMTEASVKWLEQQT